MIASICLVDRYKVEVDKYGKFEVAGHKLSIKEVPFVRYRFDNYNESDIAYINNLKNIFIHSCHLVEFSLGNNSINGVIEQLQLINQIGNIAKYFYVDVTDDMIVNGIGIYEELLRQVKDSGVKIDRYMLRDKSTKLDNLTTLRLKKVVADIVGVYQSDVGLCSSPLSHIEGYSCLTARIARELMAEYVISDKVALPSANHEGTNTCGCIRYFIVDKDIIAPEDSKKIEKVIKNEGNKDGNSKKVKKIVGYSAW